MISDSATAETTAPPTPCAARATISISCDSASPQAADATVNNTMPMRNRQPLAEQVGEPAAEQQETSERQEVGVDHPHQARLVETEAGFDRRQGDVHDRRIENDHDVAEAKHGEGEPALARGQNVSGHGLPSESLRGARPYPIHAAAKAAASLAKQLRFAEGSLSILM